MDTTTLPPPAFSPFTPVDGFDTDVVVVGSGPDGRHHRAGAGHLRGAGARGVQVELGGEHPPGAHHQPARRGGAARPRASRTRHQAQATPWDQMGDTLFTTSLAGQEIARLQTWGTGDDRRRRLPAGQPLHDAGHAAAADGAGADHQRRRARRDGLASTPSTSSHEQDADGVTVQLCDGRIRTPCSPSGPGTWSAPTAPARRSPRRSACRSRASSPGPAPSTPGSTPT